MRSILLFFVLFAVAARTSVSVEIDKNQERAGKLIARWMDAQEIASHCPAVRTILDSSILVDTREIYSNDGQTSIQIAFQISEGKERPAYSFVCNRDYASILSRYKGGQTWSLEELVKANDAGFAMYEKTKIKSGDLFRSVACFMDLRDLLMTGKFSIVDVTDCIIDGKSFLQVQLKINNPADGRYPVYSATVLFCKREGSDDFETWPSRVCMEGPKEGKFATYFWELDNKFPVAVRILQGKHLDSVPSPAKSDVNYVFKKIPYRDDVFKLSDFGYPEPEGARKRFPVFWMAGLAIGVVGIGIIVRRAFRG